MSPEISFAGTNTAVSPTIALRDTHLDIDSSEYAAKYNRVPFAFAHNLHRLDIFQFDAICDLAARYDQAYADFFVAESAAKPGSAFFDAAQVQLKPKDAIAQLDERPTRILLKRLENHDPQFRELADLLIDRLRSMPGGLGDLPIHRMQTSMFISSAAATTPLHFDPEVNFFFQIEGDKNYHVYPPTEVSERELEAFYSKGKISIGQLDIAKLDPAHEHFYELKGGRGFHQPQNSPHWVKTGDSRSISYSIVFETSADRSLARTRAFNHYERMLGMKPSAPGERPQLDVVKSEVAGPLGIARKVVDKLRKA